MKQDFALDLNGCSKEDRKKVEKAIRSTGRIKDNNIWYKKGKSEFMSFDDNSVYYLSARCNVNKGKTIYQMPRDWSKIQEALGVSVEPKDGEVWVIGGCVYRFKLSEFSNPKYYSCITPNRFSTNRTVSTFGIKATPEEEKQLIEAEHSNGYHWDGKELVKIPKGDYVKIKTAGLESWCASNCIGKIVSLDSVELGINNDCNPYAYVCVNGNSMGVHLHEIDSVSTLEAYEAQEAKKKERSNHTLDAFRFAIGRSGFGESPIKQIFESPYEFSKQYSQNPFHYDVIGLHAENEGLYVRIKELEKEAVNKLKAAGNSLVIKTLKTEINELGLEIETKDKRIAELEGNLIIMCELGNKVLS